MHILKNELLNYNFSVYIFRNSQEPLTVHRRDLSRPTRLELMLHCHDFPQVWFCYEDSFSILTENKRYELQKGSLLVIPPGVMHRSVIPEGSTPQAFRANVNFDIFSEEEPESYLNTKIHLFMGAFCRELRHDAQEMVVLPAVVCEKVFGLFSRLSVSGQADEGITAEKLSGAERLLVLEEIFSLPELAFSEQTKQRAVSHWQTKIRPMISVMTYVNNHFHEKILVSEMQKLTLLGHSTFFETFRKFIHFSFTNYLQIIRLKKAHLMMRETEYSIAQIASMCGFNSHSHMERTYKKYSGVNASKARAHAIEWIREYAKRTE